MADSSNSPSTSVSDESSEAEAQCCSSSSTAPSLHDTMDCLLAVCDYIVEFYPSTQPLSDGTRVEVMATRPRSDIYINLPALEKLDAMLIEIMDSFQKAEFWYADAGTRSFGSVTSSSSPSSSFRRSTTTAHRNEDKWWVPVPCVPEGGLSVKARKELRQRRDCANQIHKAAVAINSGVLSDMESLLLCIKHRFPGLSQTTLDTSKIQFNKDVGQAILESYSRVLESLAFNIVSWTDEVLFADKAARK
ncbi:Rop guanine nucleotide exchange factor 2 [Triticum urartu]|uniref:PRONE domain-containing protein n=2 Tax=Triticum TaxID=4564 RepID=A0A9R0UV63_TRITD|nr:Rop guanine nucleotide exchange factor 2 [Triticum urartu]VAH06078.1 unnamed protein product [Triticum turgidum subsp. durum]